MKNGPVSSENCFPPDIRTILKQYGATKAFTNNDIYVKMHDEFLIMFSYVAIRSLVIVTIADTLKTCRQKTAILAELNNACVVGTHLIENGHYLFRGNIWLNRNEALDVDNLNLILGRMIIEAHKGSNKIYERTHPHITATDKHNNSGFTTKTNKDASH